MAAESTTVLTSAHARAQLGLRASVIRDLIKLFPMWDPFDAASYDRFLTAVALLAEARSANSAALAARYYQMYKAADAGLTWGIAAALVEPPSLAEIDAAVRATMVPGFWRGIAAGQTIEQAKKSALVQLSGGVTRVVLNGGRDTLLGAIKSDGYYHGWIRVSDGKPCAFCSMLLSRGPVYWTKETAGGSVRFHDWCGCTARPFRDGDEWPVQNRQLREQWDATTQGESGNDALNAFRRSMDKGVSDGG
jgi:hypothetical protein